mmetsp:Transcript_59739/g.175254  ORF Transcript_59739/g.175254 Transcript_59739/m.175254 type:complete len:205 (+) Transcript_59739:117-731(+)
MTPEDRRRRHKAAAAAHDRFNAAAVTPIMVVLALCLALPSPDGAKAANSALTWLILAYTCADLLYIVLAPHCQVGPMRWSTILLHHVVTLWLICHPILYPRHRHLVVQVAIVEVNTFVRILQRLTRWPLLEPAFMATWVTMRLVWCPYLVYSFHREALAQGFRRWGYTYCQTVGSQAVLCCLNLFWSGEFAMSLSRRRHKLAAS